MAILRAAYVHSMHARLNVRKIAERGAARHIAFVRKALHGHARIGTNPREDRSAESIRAICLVGGLFDHDAAVEKAPVAFVGFFGMVGMHRMGVVATCHHARRKSAAQVLPTEAESVVYAFKDVAQHG